MTALPRNLLAGAFAAAISVSSVAADTSPTLLGTFSDWSAFQTSTSQGRTCYALAKPKSS